MPTTSINIELTSLIRWYLSLKSFPETPYKIAPWLLAYEGYWDRLKQECRSALDGKTPRSRSGGLQAELVLVKRAIEGVE